MEHFYDKIDGFFNYHELYSKAIKLLPNNAHIVEIGAYKGCSSAYLAVECINSGKNIKIDIIDSWNGDDGSGRPAWSDYNNINGDIFDIFKKNLEPVLDKINPIKMLSDDAVKLYDDKSIDFLFIDGSHSYDGVKKDINNWLPKMKTNGIISGHDYNPISWPGVIKAVHEFFDKARVEVIVESWMVQL